MKNRYISKLSSFDDSGNKSADPNRALYHSALGDVYYWEQSYDEAASEYLFASELLRNLGTESSDRVYNQTYIDSMLKLGLIFETNHNYSEAQNIYLQASKDSEKIFYSNKKSIAKLNSVYDAKLDYLTHGYWARLFLNIKRSPEAYDKKSIPPSHIIEMYAECEEVMYYKLGIYYFFINNFNRSFYYFQKIIEHVESKKPNKKYFSERYGFLLGRAYLYLGLLSTIIGMKKLTSSFHSVSTVTSSRLEPIIHKIFENLKSCSTLENINSQFKELSTVEIFTHKNKEDNSNILSSSIYFLLKSKYIFSKSGLNTNSVYSHMAIVFVWGLFLESIPRRLVSHDFKEENNISKDDKKLKSAYQFIENQCKSSYSDSIKTHQKSFAEFIKKHYALDIGNVIGRNGGNKHFNVANDINPISLLIRIFNQENIGSSEYPTNISRIYWQRSLQGQYLIELYIWQKRAFQNFIGDTERRVDLNINNFPQFGVRSFSLALILSGKNKLVELRNLRKSRTTLSFEKINKIAGSAILYFYRTTLYISQSSGNEQEVTFPPQSHVYYNMWETLLELLEIHLENITKYNSDYIRKLSKENHDSSDLAQLENIKHEKISEGELWKLINRITQSELYAFMKEERNIEEVPFSMYDIDTVQKLAEKYLSRTFNGTDCYSKVHQDVLSEKYYLADNYDDPTFISDFFYFKAFSSPSLFHLYAIKKGMNNLRRKEKNTLSEISKLN